MAPSRRRIRAAVCRAFDAPLALEELDLRGPGTGEVGLAVRACAICHSDVAYLRGAWGGTLPAVYGHEVAGVVEEVGADVVGIAPGDRAVVTLVRSCGRCVSCLRGLPALCEGHAELPLSRSTPLATPAGAPVVQGVRTAGFAEHVTVHASQVIPLPREVPFASAAVLGCGVLTGVGAVLRTAAVEAGESVGVIGCGGVGLNAVQGAVIAGAARIVALDTRAPKLAAARAFGATDALDAAGDVAAQVRELTGGRGLDHVVVTAAATAAVEQALALVARGGAVVLVGMPPNARVAIDPETIADSGLRILGSKVGSAQPRLDVPRLVDLYLAGRLRLDELVSGSFPLAAIEDAIATVERGEALRSVVVP